MQDRILRAILFALLDYFVPKLSAYVRDVVDGKKSEEEIASAIKGALEAAARPVDQSLPQEEREKQSEKDMDDFFDKLKPK